MLHFVFGYEYVELSCPDVDIPGRKSANHAEVSRFIRMDSGVGLHVNIAPPNL